MKIALIGAGNLATNLGLALKECGEQISQVYSRTTESASALAGILNVGYTTDLDAVVKNADLYVVSIKDSALQAVLPRLVKGRKQALFVHTAGSLPLSVWQGLTERGAVFYPMQTFSKAKKVNFSKIPCFLETMQKEDMAILDSLAEKLTHEVYHIDSVQRKYLHLSAVFACNFTNYMYNVSAQLLKEQKIPFDVMLPLIDETAEKVHKLTPMEAQTGPAVRYDENVINQQMQLLDTHAEWRELYEQISKCIHNDKLRFEKN